MICFNFEVRDTILCARACVKTRLLTSNRPYKTKIKGDKLPEVPFYLNDEKRS